MQLDVDPLLLVRHVTREISLQKATAFEHTDSDGQT
jgi:hypothetical protein